MCLVLVSAVDSLTGSVAAQNVRLQIANTHSAYFIDGIPKSHSCWQLVLHSGSLPDLLRFSRHKASLNCNSNLHLLSQSGSLQDLLCLSKQRASVHQQALTLIASKSAELFSVVLHCVRRPQKAGSCVPRSPHRFSSSMIPTQVFLLHDPHTCFPVPRSPHVVCYS